MFLQRLRLLRDYLGRQPAVTAPPVTVLVETTNRCNFRCIMCGSKHLPRPRGDMEFTCFCRIIDEIKEWCECVDLSFSGEPLLHPDVIRQIAYVKRTTRLGVFLETNGSVLNREMAERLMDCGLDYLTVDIDGATKQTYESVRVGGDYDWVVQNTLGLLALRDRRGSPMRVEVAIIAMQETRREIDPFVAQWRQSGVDHVRIKPFMARLACAPSAPLEAHAVGWAPPPVGCSCRPCFLLWRELVVLVDGTIGACCLDQQCNGDGVMGHLDEGSILEAWFGPAAENIRRKHAEGRWTEVAFCRGCSPINPNQLLVLATPFFDSLSTKRVTSLTDSWLARLGGRIY